MSSKDEFIGECVINVTISKNKQTTAQ